MAARAGRAASLARPDRNQDTLVVAGEMGCPVDEARKALALVEKPGNQHGVES